MRGNLPTIIFVVVVLALLVALNLVFMAEPREAENELSGDRSSYRASPYGTLAFYTLLSESGRRVERFERPYTSLADTTIATLLVIAPAADSQPSKEEIEALETWVGAGGSLVVIDREIQLPTALGDIETGEPLRGVVRAVTPSPFTRGVDELKLTGYATTVQDGAREAVVHFAGTNGALLIDKPYGEGHVAFLTEPFVVQNNGIREKSNLALALNLVDGLGRGGEVAFDEYHHGHGDAAAGHGGGLRDYIAGTPVPWIVVQLALLAGVVAITVGARFGRPIPLGRERRTSALEFVSSMANIQRLARASDLAIENVYSSFRSRLCRYANVASDTPAAALASSAAARGRIDPARVLSAINRCEEAARGNTLSSSELLALVGEIRSIESDLKL